MKKTIHVAKDVTLPLQLFEDDTELKNKAIIALSPDECRLAMAACMVNQSHLYNMRMEIEKKVAENAAFYQRLTNLWEAELAGIDERLEREKQAASSETQGN
jgi:hypothetical protein